MTGGSVSNREAITLDNPQRLTLCSWTTSAEPRASASTDGTTVEVDSTVTRRARRHALERSWALRAAARADDPVPAGWADDAPCIGHDYHYRTDRRSQRVAELICGTCELRLVCLGVTLREESQHNVNLITGTRGGFTANARRRMWQYLSERDRRIARREEVSRIFAGLYSTRPTRRRRRRRTT